MRITNALRFSVLLLFSTGCANFASLDWSREIGWIIPGPEVGATSPPFPARWSSASW
jgi:hypothetical protein